MGDLTGELVSVGSLEDRTFALVIASINPKVVLGSLEGAAHMKPGAGGLQPAVPCAEFDPKHICNRIFAGFFRIL